ncbi:hypothetical protein T265_11452 [Opisthorchis viverrini]|uniref:DAGKc domain-containing protein n=1 Tax=Opisthorchis viverrini TaxID=6198 RepID=A0A074YYZ0_OPIVI|nr:hypothetical protein T265_11452 [Opisthorchis viverrini]KER19888.1 hypothetical protein T265_11452 [Opisthorchis viverrini]
MRNFSPYYSVRSGHENVLTMYPSACRHRHIFNLPDARMLAWQYTLQQLPLWGNRLGLVSVSWDNGERLLRLSADYKLFLCSTNVPIKKSSQQPSSGGPQLITLPSLKSITDYRSFWKTCGFWPCVHPESLVRFSEGLRRNRLITERLASPSINRFAFQDRDRVIPIVCYWRQCKILPPIGVNDVSFCLDFQNECLEVDVLWDYCVVLRDIIFVCSVDMLHQHGLPAKVSKRLNNLLGLRRDFPQTGFVVSHLARAEKHKWRTKEIVFWCSSSEECEKWTAKLNESVLNTNPLRPRHLLVFVNPNSGHRRAVQTYEGTVRPLFELARIKTHVIVTTHRGHVTEYLLENKLDNYDGVICVGGDGFLAEAVQGVLLCERIKANLPLHSEHRPGTVEVPSAMRLGIIPAGSTDTVVFSTQGTNDVLSSILHIIIGDDLPLDVAAIHSGDDGSFVRYAMSLVGYGFHADLLKNDDKLRWMGPKRYDCAAYELGAMHISRLPSLSCNILPVPSCHATRRKHEGWDTARLPKPRQGKSRGRGRLRATDFPSSRPKFTVKTPGCANTENEQQDTLEVLVINGELKLLLVT